MFRIKLLVSQWYAGVVTASLGKPTIKFSGILQASMTSYWLLEITTERIYTAENSQYYKTGSLHFRETVAKHLPDYLSRRFPPVFNMVFMMFNDV